MNNKSKIYLKMLLKLIGKRMKLSEKVAFWI
jgi:hypothetical protein